MKLKDLMLTEDDIQKIGDDNWYAEEYDLCELASKAQLSKLCERGDIFYLKREYGEGNAGVFYGREVFIPLSDLEVE